MRRTGLAIIAFACVVLLFACSSGEPKKPAEEQAAQPAPAAPKTDAITGRIAFQNMYRAARTWSVDAQGFRLESAPSADATGADGKAAVWRGRFGSISRGTAKPVMWSGSIDPDAPSRGLDTGGEDSFNPNNSSTRPFDIAFLKSDSDTAFKVAQQHGGKKILDKNPKTPVRYLLQWDPQRNSLVWHVTYGERSDLRVAVNASTGEFIRVER